MSSIKFGCQTYSWQMTMEKYSGNISHIADIVSQSGFEGLEAEVCMLGEHYFSEGRVLNECLELRKLAFGALALPLPWVNSEETVEEKRLADRAIEFVSDVPGSILVLCHLPGETRDNLRIRQRNQIACITQVAKRAEEKGVVTAFHPNSSMGSIFRTEEDYEILMDGINNTPLGYVPDAGHIAHGGMDPLKIIKRYHEKIKHVHFKDMDCGGHWKTMGKGEIDFPGIVNYLAEIAYSGWIMVEEESKEARVNPDKAAFDNGKYIQKLKDHYEMN